MLRAPTLLTLVVVTILLPVVCHAEGGWKAGVARQNITPEESMWMSGYGSRDHPSEGKLADLWAKALVLEDASGKQVVLISLDLVGIDRELATEIMSKLQVVHKLKRSQVAFCCSHTHTGPALKRNLAPLHYLVVDREQQKKIEEYEVKLQQNVVVAVNSAFQKLAPAKLSWGNGNATFATNRRENRPEANVPQRRTEGKLAGPIDHDVPVLAIRNESNELVSILFGYACHSTVLSIYQWSGDYPGFAQTALEAKHPGAIAMFWAGCGADQNPLPRRTIELAKHYGERLATAVDTVLLTTQMREVDPKLTASFQEVDLPLDTLPTREQIDADTTSKNKWVAARAKMLLEKTEEGKSLPKTYPYAIGSWRLGDEIDLVFLGGEVVVDYAIRLKSELRGTQTWVAGYSNDVMAYIPSRRVLREGGYEGGTSMVYYGLPAHWSPDVERMIVDEVHHQLPTKKAAEQ